MDNMKHRRLQELDRSDFKIVDGEPDIRGWDVKNSSGTKVGEVEELIVDAEKKKVRYMVVDFDHNDLDLDNDLKVLIPIGLAQLDKDDDDVILQGVTVEQLHKLPGYDKNHLDEDVERRISTILGRGDTMSNSSNTGMQDDFYQHEYFNDDNLYKNRLHQRKPAPQNSEAADYERGLRLWEMRSEGGIIPDTGSSGNYSRSEIEEDARMEMVHNRRNTYEQRRYGTARDKGNYSDSHTHRKDNSIERRIRDEGLRDA